ncbi:hypothetical protein [Frigoribacterium salinisoli]
MTDQHDPTPAAPHAEHAEHADGAPTTGQEAAGHDPDGLLTLRGRSSGNGAEKAGTPEAADDAEREAAAPGPADVHVASDEYLETPRLGGVTASDTQV